MCPASSSAVVRRERREAMSAGGTPQDRVVGAGESADIVVRMMPHGATNCRAVCRQLGGYAELRPASDTLPRHIGAGSALSSNDVSHDETRSSPPRLVPFRGGTTREPVMNPDPIAYRSAGDRAAAGAMEWIESIPSRRIAPDKDVDQMVEVFAEPLQRHLIEPAEEVDTLVRLAAPGLMATSSARISGGSSVGPCPHPSARTGWSTRGTRMPRCAVHRRLRRPSSRSRASG